MNEGVQNIRASYDELPYYSFPYPGTAPENLAAIAHLFGLDAPDTRNARVLELGCASGGNMIPFAARHPKARVVGIDLSAVQVEEGQQRIAALKLRNIELRAMDLTTITREFGTFDYIVCHGLYSWVPDEAREAILRICRDNLAEQGVAYVSYKTYPGWKAHEIVRDAMLLRAGRDGDIKTRLGLGRGMIDFLRTHARGDSVLASAIGQDHSMIAHADANYIAHDFLAGFNAPCYFLDFVKHAEQHGMAYLGEADAHTMFATNYGEAVARPLLDECGGNQEMLEQYLDFVSDRSFRSTLLVHGARKPEIRHRVDETRLRQFHISASLACADDAVRFDASPQAFRTPSGNGIVLDQPLSKAAVVALTQAAPFTMSFEQMRDAAREHAGDLADDALDAALTTLIASLVIRGVAQYRLEALTRGQANPELGRIARDYPAQLPEGQAPHTFNAWHAPVVLDTAGQLLLPYIDGKHTRAQLLGMLEQAVAQGLSLDAETGDAGAVLDRLLRQLCA
jgi:methyltransferase-like protein